MINLMRKIHLKTWPEYFRMVLSGDKNFEVRKNDHDFQVGDMLILQEWDPSVERYTGYEIEREVVYILKGGQFGIGPEYCVMSLGNNTKVAS
jgi:hypothetical protein